MPVSETVNWTNNITYMLQSKNKETGERLSIIPEYTLNSTLSWQAREDLSLQSTFTWYGKQQPKNTITVVNPLPVARPVKSAHTAS